ncbi:type 1 fimbrial protein [Cronobacter malonaticus]|uniref:type 1 fimbrial protein n=1 Tax=Cronobacter malonaticus TaxID=413503 RepID=UPI000CFB8CBC|nr:type 1 fimbrial protein [Cronobacter malonaticus]ELY2765525.1 type 1 fimbrial protein [Cronobacter malonaticus]MDT3580373.1 type 1 fimbrial protein [Cronobacter malonaticus]MDT3620798.1 type 1 fimbrial protein [Cronobacter malonaticus]
MHKQLFVTLITAALVGFSGPGLAQAGGTITFHGAIVEEGCSVARQAARIEVSCLRGNQVHRQTLSLRSSGVRERHSSWVSSRLDYLNPAHTLGILTLTYR